MEKFTKQQILESLEKLYENAKDCQLEASFLNVDNEDFNLLSRYFKTTKTQTLLITMVFVMNYDGRTVDLNDLVKHFGCNPMKILALSDDFDFLCKQGIFKKEMSRHRMKMPNANDQFTIHEKITDAILQSLPMPEIQQQEIQDVLDVLEMIYSLSSQRDDGLISTYDLLEHTKTYMDENIRFPLIKKIKQLNLNIENNYLFLYLIWETLTGRESVNIGQALEKVYGMTTRRLRILQNFFLGENILIKNNLIELKETQFFNHTEMKLTDESTQLLNENGIRLFQNKKKKDNMMLPSEINSKELIFDPQEMQQLYFLKDLLADDKLMETQNRLEGKGLPTGITVLLHGAPGTGKTEIVKQLAKDTDRAIMKVEISQSKSMWFGESEKIIKRIFLQYQSFAKDCKRTPILFFNEADAIISTRKEIGSSNVAQTENAIQNILLEELENFEGILFATTNLVEHLDKAFERRFLFKVPFQKPSASIRAKIWKSKLPEMEMADCVSLAAHFDFSGGQIDNVIRKNEMQEIIHGTFTNFETILNFCKEESLSIKKDKIGFIKS